MAGLVSGCATIAWYGQAARGQIEVLAKREDIADKIADPATPEPLRHRLETVLEMRAFATRELGLPDSRSYTLYADLERDAPLWNVVAAPRFSVVPETWCYPLVGCLAYRGYFRLERAQSEARRLAEEGLDVAVFPATAYSTLGWFADPVLDSMLTLSDAHLAELIFHELSHELLYVSGDTAFNEAFATFVGREGVRRWLGERGDDEALDAWRAERELDAKLTNLLLDARQRLAEQFATLEQESALEQARVQAFERLKDELRALTERPGGDRLQGWIDRPINNAHLALVATYESGIEAFEALFHERCDAQLACLYQHVERLSEADAEQRATFLHGGH
ncbi:aminopeptidase [Wenzhouxiangella sp. XN201]|uniref:aminopeptidase n=1 Tax=Wenzhouxiangella sp. XN201 TaxID=2710755 RepID=UPI0013C672CB|nr:aminopeptidase [Wenzhouxiangella sp. XN201]NEZ02832.1 aminopeptidase [Wenzhouxiangella sp. XN201]